MSARCRHSPEYCQIWVLRQLDGVAADRRQNGGTPWVAFSWINKKDHTIETRKEGMVKAFAKERNSMGLKKTFVNNIKAIKVSYCAYYVCHWSWWSAASRRPPSSTRRSVWGHRGPRTARSRWPLLGPPGHYSSDSPECPGELRKSVAVFHIYANILSK